MRGESAFKRGFDVEVEVVYEIALLRLQTEAVKQKSEGLSLALAGAKLIGNASAIEDLEEITPIDDEE